MLKINKKYIMKKSELKEYDLLPDIPENKLTKKQVMSHLKNISKLNK